MKQLPSIKHRRLAVLLLCLTLVLASCSTKNEASYDSPADGLPRSADNYGFYTYDEDMTLEAASEDETAFTPSKSPDSDPLLPDSAALGGYENLEQKLIYIGYLSVETLDFDQTCSGVEEMIRQYGGYTEASNLSGRTVYRGEEGMPTLVDRYATYTLRIPKAKFSDFMAHAGDLGNVTDVSTQLENISPQFYDTQSRLDAYQIQYDRLLSLLEKADRIEDILALESQLTEVRYRIEAMTTQLRGWQSQVDYSTVHLNVREVTRYTPPEKQSYPERLVKAISGSLSRFIELIGNFIIDFIYIIPWIVVLVVVYLLVRRFHPLKFLPKRRKKKKDASFPAGNSYEPIPTEKDPVSQTEGGHEALSAQDENELVSPADQ
ncbi:MAG: DUF4349 domain-containing protein [Clostridia bacterium]|nr:DUF4349 domain-containing protein [Clostridia bacterium]